ncbi:MAG: zinc-binding alcohol dehydrogenase family protein [Methylotetracoccus sp.]
MLLERIGALSAERPPLIETRLPEPVPMDDEVLIRVSVCGVCHTELDEIEGRLTPSRLPIVLGHQAVGRVVGHGAAVRAPVLGQRVGVAWIHAACGACRHCLAGDENLCAAFRATGRDVDGGYAEYLRVPAAFAHPVPETISDEHAAPLLCAGAIGYRSLRLAGVMPGSRLGLTGFGASAHLVLQMVRYRHPDVEVFVFARDPEERRFALELGAVWAGDVGERAPAMLHAIIDTTPVWRPIVRALEHLEPGGRLVVNAIRKEGVDKDALLELNYASHLWMEREIKSVANVTRGDVREFLDLAAGASIRPEIEFYDLADANRALLDLKTRRVRGAKVLRIGA